MVSARRGTLRLLRALMLGAVVVPAALFAYVAWVSWGSIVQLTDDRLVRSLDVLHEQALKVLTTGNLVLDEIVESVENATPDQITAREGELHRRLKRVADLLPQVQSIWVIDRDGYALANSYFVPAPRGASLADRDFFRAQIDRDVGTYVSSVYTPRLIEGPSFFSMSRRLNGPNGSFQGVASVSMLPGDFEKFYREIARSPGEVFALMREDGAFLARWPAGPLADTKLPAASRFFGEIARAPQRGLYSGVSRIDGVERRVGYRRIEGFPVYVVASVEAASIRAEWLAGLRGHLVFGLPATLLLLWVLWVAHQRTASLYAEAMRREAAETALRQAQRLEAVGRLTGGVAHDFNNLLMVISGSADRLRRLVDGEKESRLVEMITTAAKRGETLTRQLLSFSRQQAVSPQSIDLAQRMPELSELIRRSLADDVEVVIDVPGRVCPVKVDPSEFEVAVLNICVNARDAMPKGGRLVVRVRDAVLDEEGENGLAGAFVSLSFIDTGTGIPEELLPRVFEPFFTTKETAKGTGLGLSQVYGFARQAGGDVRITSRVGEGTRVTLWLPWVAFEPAAVAEAPPEPATRSAERRTVLVVEDNRSVADVCGAYLEQLGYDVRVAASPRDALATLRGADEPNGAGRADDSREARRVSDSGEARRASDSGEARRAHGVDLVLSDILMPGGMSGVDLTRELRALDPGLPVVLMTGFSDRAGEVARDGFPVLRKPFDIGQLERELAAALARPDGSAAA